MKARDIAVADCETDPFKINRVPKPFIWGYYDGKEYKEFYTTDDFVAFIRIKRIILYAHNGGKFDWHFLLDHLEPYADIMVINGRIAKCYIGDCELRDSYNILPVPLKAYKKDDIDYKLMEADKRHIPKNWRTICKYLKSDCVYLYELVSGFIGLYGMQITQASAAMAQWKKIHKYIPQTDKDFYEKFSSYYYGGRVECFQSGVIDVDFSVWDINSAYPHAMMFHHPYSETYSHAEGYVSGADFYTVNCISRGAFPFRGLGTPDNAAGLRFPNDDEMRTYTITGWEYQAAIETNTIEKVDVIESYLFDDHVNFEPYVMHFYNMRLEAKARKDEAQSLFAKLLMNSLYGKFAANPENYRNNMIVPMDVIGGLDRVGWEFAGELGPWGLAEASLTEEQLHYYNVATGASITGFVRAMLWRAICSSKGVLYCDTDSIAACGQGASVLLGDALGQWKHEGYFDRAGIAGKKLYIFRGKPQAGGTREYKTAAKGAKLTNSQLWQVAAGGHVNYESETPTFSVKKNPAFVKRRLKNTA